MRGNGTNAKSTWDQETCVLLFSRNVLMADVGLKPLPVGLSIF